MTPEQKAQEFLLNFDLTDYHPRIISITIDSFLAGYNADKSELEKEVNYWKERFNAAEEVVKAKSFDDSIAAYQRWQKLQNQENEK